MNVPSHHTPGGKTPDPPRPAVWETETRSAAETVALGERIGRMAQPGWVLALTGDLGAGKTTFTRGLAAGAGADPREVTSPTFVFLHRYAGRIPVYHLDLYRVEGAEAARGLGVDEFVGGDGVAVVEWSERAPELLPPARLEIELTILTGERRRITLRTVGEGPGEVPGGARTGGRGWQDLLRELWH